MPIHIQTRKSIDEKRSLRAIFKGSKEKKKNFFSSKRVKKRALKTNGSLLFFHEKVKLYTHKKKF